VFIYKQYMGVFERSKVGEMPWMPLPSLWLSLEAKLYRLEYFVHQGWHTNEVQQHLQFDHPSHSSTSPKFGVHLS